MSGRLLLPCAGLLLACVAEAQIPQGAVIGSVMDPSGARVHGAEMVLENQATGVKRSGVSNEEGLFSFNYLDSSLYRLTVKAPGFKTGLYPGIPVAAGAKVRVDARLALYTLLPIVCLPVVCNLYGNIVHRRFRIVQDEYARLSARTQENLAGIRVVKAFVQEESETKTFEKLNDIFYDCNIII